MFSNSHAPKSAFRAGRSQIREFLEGNINQPSEAIDMFIWLATTGYRKIRISGPIPENLMNRTQRPNRSIEKFLIQNLYLFFQEKHSRSFIERKYIQFNNEMTADDSALLALATEGKIEFDLDRLEKYVGERRFKTGAYIFQRELYEEAKAEEVKAPEETKGDKSVKTPMAKVPSFVETPVKPAEDVVPKVVKPVKIKPPKSKNGSDPLSIAVGMDNKEVDARSAPKKKPLENNKNNGKVVKS